MAIDYKPLLEQFGKDYRESRRKELLADVALLQKGTPGMRFDEAWDRALAANPELLQVEEVPRE